MKIRIFDDQQAMAKAAADQAIQIIQQALAARGQSRIIVETGESQITFLRELSSHREIDWGNVEVFCAAEYIGLPADHPASLQRFLQDRLISKTGIRKFVSFAPESNLARIIADVSNKLRAAPLDLSIVGIGENGQLGLNNPPADFDTGDAYLAVDLDFKFRAQQVAEGWFVDIGLVPMQAVTITIPQLLKSNEILAVVPGSRRALAVKVCAEHGISPTAPVTILRTHPNVTVYLDRDSAAQLSAGVAGQSIQETYTKI